MVFAVITMVFMAILYVSGRALKGVHPTVVQIHYVFWGVLICSVLIQFEEVDHKLFAYSSSSTYWLLLVMGIFNTAAMYLFIYTNMHAKSTTVAMYRNVAVLMGFLTDVVIFKQSFTFLQCFGAAIVLGSNVASVYSKIKEEANPKFEDS